MEDQQAETVTPEEIALRRAGFVLRDKGPNIAGRSYQLFCMATNRPVAWYGGQRSEVARTAWDLYRGND